MGAANDTHLWWDGQKGWFSFQGTGGPLMLPPKLGEEPAHSVKWFPGYTPPIAEIQPRSIDRWRDMLPAEVERALVIVMRHAGEAA